MSTKRTPARQRRGNDPATAKEVGIMSTVATTTDSISAEQWGRWAQASHTAEVVKSSALDPNATPCPDWCTDSPHTFECDPLDRMHCSDSVSLPLQHHGGAKRQESVLVFPVAEVRLGRAYTTTEPLIELSRRVPQPNGAMTINEGATYHFSPAEAAELGRVLLGAVDVALGLAEKAAK